VVFAAASLREAFTSLGEEFKRAHPGVALTFNFAGTQELRTQIEHGAAADVFASADERHMNELVKAGRATGPVVFARNEPVVVVAKESADELREFSDLPHAARIVVGAPEVPIGRYTEQLLERANAHLGPDFRARVEAKIVSRELNVKQVLTKVRLGEAQAAIVYKSDAKAAEKEVRVVAIPPYMNLIARYPIAVLSAAAHPRLAREWIELVLSRRGQETLARAGFAGPSLAPRKP